MIVVIRLPNADCVRAWLQITPEREDECENEHALNVAARAAVCTRFVTSGFGYAANAFARMFTSNSAPRPS